MRKNKRSKEKKKKKGIGRIILIILLFLMIAFGAYFGYSISVNGGGLQGLLATVLDQDTSKLEELDPINVLLLRSESRFRL